MYRYKYNKYKHKYLDYFSYMSGPVSVYAYSSRELNKRIILLGDSHSSWSNMCYDGNKNPIATKLNFHKEKIDRCDKNEGCYYIEKFLKEVRSNLAVGEILDFFYEGDYYKNPLEAHNAWLAEEKEAAGKQIAGPLIDVLLKYGVCNNEHVECFNQMRVHQADYRTQVGKQEEIFNEIENLKDNMHEKPDDYIISQYGDIINNLVNTHNGRLNDMVLNKIEDINLANMMNELEPEMNMCMDEYISKTIHDKLEPLFKIFIVAIDESKILRSDGKTNKLDKDTLIKHLEEINTFLVTFNALFMDLFVLCRIMQKDVDNVIVYAGNEHILEYIGFIDSIIKFKKIFGSNLNRTTIESSEGDTDIRCVRIPNEIMNKLLKMKF